ncbi:MAG TPA: WbqC family protein [Puia sp.]|jgi:hypothetical protein
MRLAIMQPYIFPYIGYFQLINSVDKFVIYDDVNFIKQGWINRNNILLNGDRHLFTIPVENLTSFKKINEINLSPGLYEKWLGKFCKTLQAAYKKAPYFEQTWPLIMRVLEAGKEETAKRESSISALCTGGIRLITEYLGIGTLIAGTSSVYHNDSLSSYERVLDICKKEKAHIYINAIGGRELYSKELFKAQGIDLFFLQPGPISYTQYRHEFVPHLSIIDCLMFNSPESMKTHIQNFSLL